MKRRKTKPGLGMQGLIIPAAVLLPAGSGWLLFGRPGFKIVLMMVFAGYALVSLDSAGMHHFS